MLFWRIVIGIPVVLILVGLFYLDELFFIRGVVLMPLFLVCLYFLCTELLNLLHAGGLHPRRSTVYIGTYMMTFCCWLICAGHNYIAEKNLTNEMLWKWSAGGASMGMILVLASGVLIAFVGEMWRYKRPGGVTINLAGAVFVMGYLGLLTCFLILLRMVHGILPLLSMVIVTKMNDTGAYTVGRLMGRHKLAPELSPKKTIEGGIGGVVFAVFGGWFFFNVLCPQNDVGVVGWASYSIVVALAGALGDLACSLIKRDVGIKDSGTLVPGFGGFLDLFDSLILAAPVAFFWWTFCLPT